MAAGLKILLSGMLAGNPHQGGATWVVLQYALGLRRLGHEVTVVEPVPPEALQPPGSSLARSANASYFLDVMREFGFAATSALLLAETRETVGMSYEDVREAASESDLILNINGILGEEELLERAAVRVYMDIDAGFNQLWQAVGIDRRFGGHTHHVTIGQGIGEAWSPVPTCGVDWLKSVQPVVLEHWPVAQTIIHDAMTTVGNWRSSGPLEYNGIFIGQKVHSLRPLFRLPTRTSERFLLALAIHSDEKRDLEALHRNGWGLVDPAQVASTPSSYREFVRGSKAEFGLVQQGCLAAPCGWFSDRSAGYLASGRPVVAQQTEFSRWLPTGEGVFAFRTEEEALRAIEELNRDYRRHARAARALAEEYFDSDKVLSRLLEQVGA
jgi:glycosyltransferase involved in cell wall biosynthesis